METTVEGSGPGINFRWKIKNIHELHENHFLHPYKPYFVQRHYKYLNNKYREVGQEIIITFIKVGHKSIIRKYHLDIMSHKALISTRYTF